MVKIGNVNEAANMQGGNVGRNMVTDSFTKNLQNRIADAQKRLQELSSNEGLSMEEKMKKRQELQQEITNLNQQLRQHQIECQKEQQKAKTSMEDLLGGNRNESSAKQAKKGTGLSNTSMQAMLCADASMKQAQVHQSTAANLEGRANVLESEIKMDSGRGTSTKMKEEELADVRQKAQEATASQTAALAQAYEAVKEAASAESEEKANASKTEKKNDQAKEQEGENILKGKESETAVAGMTKPETSDLAYTPVDIRL